MPSTLASSQSAPMSPSSSCSSLTSLESNPPTLKPEKSSVLTYPSSIDQKPYITSQETRSFKIKTRSSCPYSTPDIKPSITGTSKLSVRRSKPPKNAPKKFSLNSSPFPKFSHPTLLESQEVCNILSHLHGGTPKRPEKVTHQINLNLNLKSSIAQSCGEVSDILEALIRTILSQNTSTLNSNRAYSNIIERYGSFNFERIRKSGIEELKKTIRVGGLAERKSKVIIKVLNQIISKGDGTLSLDKLRSMSDEEVMQELVEFDGVGIKTGACVSMFCLGRDTFPVDTHVHRLSKSLGWVPSKSTRDQAFFHLNLHLPNDLKYALHILMIRHDQSCRQCSPASKEPSKKPNKKVMDKEFECPLKRLMTSTS
ncbi:DNA glycosylase [Melampsora americana]|nr:DNA glycosylase [Melampsora americana]